MSWKLNMFAMEGECMCHGRWVGVVKGDYMSWKANSTVEGGCLPWDADMVL